MRLGGLGSGSASFWGRPVVLHRVKTDPYDHYKSVTDTIRILRHQARADAQHPVVTAATHDACSRLMAGAASQRDICCAIFYWVRAHVRFIEDEAIMLHQLGIPMQELDKELLIPAPVLLGMPVPQGDCDDFSLLTAAMCLNAGIAPIFVTVAADPYEPPDKFTHIYVAAMLQDEGDCIALDAGNRKKNVPPGWEVSEGVTRKAGWAI